MKYVLSLFVISLVIISCKKNNNFPPHGDFYFQLRENGKPIQFGSCGLFGGPGEMECDLLGDTLLFIAAGCGSYATFLIKTNTAEGVYELNGINNATAAASGGEYNDYTTDSAHTGILTIKKVLYQNSYCLQGNFSYSGVDTAGVVGVITEGNFFMHLTY